MRILVLGGTHFIGPFVVKRLHAMSHAVTVFHRGRREADLPADIEHLHGDRQRLADFRDQLAGLAPDVALDLCAFTEQDAQVAVQVFQGIAGRAVVISSGDVYYNYGLFGHTRTEAGPPHPDPFTEEGPLRQTLFPHRKLDTGPVAPHDQYEKILVERVYLGSPDLPGTVLRLPMVYGPGDNQHRLFPYLKRMDDGRPAIFLPEGWAQNRFSRGYVEDVAAAIVRAVLDDRVSGRVYNVAEPEALTEMEWVRRVGEVIGWNGEILVDPQSPHAIDPEEAPHLAYDTRRIRAELGFAEEIPQAEALRRTVEWERAHPPEKIDPGAFDYAAEDVRLRELSDS
jgi:nucleoside-diphosphate-sugar epimerase